MPLTPETAAALRAPAVLLFDAVEIMTATGPLRLLDGAGTASFAGRTFIGRDPVYGALRQITADGDGMDAEAPELTLELLPPTNSAMAALAGPDMQGRAVSYWIGVMNADTGQVIGAPDLRFVGEVDVPERSIDQGESLLTLRCTSVFESFFAVQEGARLSDGFHQSVWPGELGFDKTTGVDRRLYWGQDTPAAAVSSGGGGSRGGGGGGGSFVGEQLQRSGI